MKSNFTLAYATNSAVASNNAFVQLTIPYSGYYLLVGYVNNDSNGAAWLNKVTDTNDSVHQYLKIENISSFAKIVQAMEGNTFGLYNMNGKTITPYTSMYIGAIFLRSF